MSVTDDEDPAPGVDSESKKPCSEEHCKLVRPVSRLARRALRQAIRKLSRLDKEDVTRAVFEQYLGPATAEGVSDVQAKLELIEELLSERTDRESNAIFCAQTGERGCREGTIASTNPSTRVIILCTLFFDVGHDGAAGTSTLLHEGAHAALGTRPDVYKHEPSFPVLPATRGESGGAGSVARDNPDSLATFVLTLYGERRANFRPEEPEAPEHDWRGFGAGQGSKEHEPVAEAIAWLRQWFDWAEEDLLRFDAGGMKRETSEEAKRIVRLVKQFRLEDNVSRTVETLQILGGVLKSGLEIRRSTGEVGEAGALWHDKGAAFIQTRDPVRQKEIMEHKADWLDVSDAFFAPPSTEARTDALLNAMESQVTSSLQVHFVRSNGKAHLKETGIQLD